MGTLRLLVFLLLMIPSCLDAQASSGSGSGSSTWTWHRENHKSQTITTQQLKTVAGMSEMWTFRKNILEPFLIERVPGTLGNKLVQTNIKNHMKSLGWTITEDNFFDDTPHKRKEFTNIVATHNPKARRWLTLACHFDSKYFSNIRFVGATDSAVPCSMMMDLARLLNSTLWGGNGAKAEDVSLQFIFFDGEEAFQHWTATDSIYGARHLAAKMSKTPFNPEREVDLSDIERFDVFVLLDLIGVEGPAFRNWFSATERHYERLKKIEKRLIKAGLLDLSTTHSGYFKQIPAWASRGSGIGDDHEPFLKLGVPILHMIPYPFPDVWHTERDNEAVLHWKTIDNLNKIFRVFVVEYLHLSKNLKGLNK